MYALGQELQAALRAVPGVEGVAMDVYGPHGSILQGSVALPDTPDDPARAHYWPVSAQWFELFAVPIEAGRAFRPSDTEPGAPGRVVLTAALARRLFGTTEVVGRTLEAGFADRQPTEVVGVTGDLRMAGAPDTDHEAFFAPFGAYPLPFVAVLVRTRQFDAAVASGIRQAVEAVFPTLPVPDPEPLATRVDQRHSERRIFSQLLALLSGLAVVLAAVGLYGVIAFQAAGRTREFGIRLALGARTSRIAGLVLEDALRVVLVGTFAGLLGAYLLSRVLESRLFRVTPLDAMSYGGAVLILAAVATLACWTPARNATQVDPVETLRQE
jgi:hypothetical protein